MGTAARMKKRGLKNPTDKPKLKPFDVAKTAPSKNSRPPSAKSGRSIRGGGGGEMI